MLFGTVQIARFFLSAQEKGRSLLLQVNTLDASSGQKASELNSDAQQHP